MKKQRFCRICGENITLRRKHAIYCKKCAIRRRAESRKKYDIGYRKKNRERILANTRRAQKQRSFVINYLQKKYHKNLTELYEMIKNENID